MNVPTVLSLVPGLFPVQRGKQSCSQCSTIYVGRRK